MGISLVMFRFIQYIFIGAVIVLALLLAATLLPVPGNVEVKVVQSGSMEPAIKTGSLIIIKPRETYQVGDIITFGADTRTQVPTTHRITDVRASSGKLLFTTKGDANENNDLKETRERDVIGKVIFSVPYVGYLIDFARKPIGFLILIVLPAFLIVSEQVSVIVQEFLRLRKKKKDETSDTHTSV